MVASLLKLGGQEPISLCFLCLKSFTSEVNSNSRGPQIRVRKEDFIFCFPVAVPTSIAIAMADAPVMEKLCFSLYLRVCMFACVCTGVCARKGLCVCTKKQGVQIGTWECSSRVCMQVGVCKLCVYLWSWSHLGNVGVSQEIGKWMFTDLHIYWHSSCNVEGDIGNECDKLNRVQSPGTS